MATEARRARRVTGEEVPSAVGLLREAIRHQERHEEAAERVDEYPDTYAPDLYERLDRPHASDEDVEEYHRREEVVRRAEEGPPPREYGVGARLNWPAHFKAREAIAKDLGSWEPVRLTFNLPSKFPYRVDAEVEAAEGLGPVIIELPNRNLYYRD